MDTKKLKQKILDLAVRGKLVPQDPTDEPASVLMERIRAEKEQLIRDKKIKRDKNESHIFRSGKSYYEKCGEQIVCIDDEIPFEIPESWEWCRFGVVSNYGECNTTKASDIKTTDWILDLEDIEKDTGRIIRKVHQQEKQSLSNKHSFSSGQLLYSKLRPYLNKVVIADGDGFCTTEIIPINFRGWVVPKYGQIFLMSSYFLGYANMLSYGVKMPRMGTSDGRKVLFPLPPLSEQISIISQIEPLLNFVDNIENSKIELQATIQQTKAKVLDLAIRGKLVPQDPNDEPASVLLERIKADKEATAKPARRGAKKESSITDNSHYGNVPFEIPDSWVWVKLGDVGFWQSGATPSRSNKSYYVGDISWLKTGDLNDGYINDTSEKISESALQESSVKLNPIGSVLIAMYGATIGRVGILNIPATTNQACCACTKFAGVLNLYLYYFLIANRQNFINLGGGGAQPNISKEKIINTYIPLPPYKEQFRIVQCVESLYSSINIIEESLL